MKGWSKKIWLEELQKYMDATWWNWVEKDDLCPRFILGIKGSVVVVHKKKTEVYFHTIPFFLVNMYNKSERITGIILEAQEISYAGNTKTHPSIFSNYFEDYDKFLCSFFRAKVHEFLSSFAFPSNAYKMY